MTLAHPDQMIPELIALMQTYPDIPVFYNYLSVAYAQIGKFEERNAVMMECYERFPDYLFGRINYAEICLENGEIDKIPEIFDGKFDLSLLYPQRSTFHISEYASFAGIIGVYCVLIGERTAAKLYYKTLRRMVPRHPATRKLKRLLYPPLRVRLFMWVYKKVTGQEFMLKDAFKQPNNSQHFSHKNFSA